MCVGRCRVVVEDHADMHQQIAFYGYPQRSYTPQRVASRWLLRRRRRRTDGWPKVRPKRRHCSDLRSVTARVVSGADQVRADDVGHFVGHRRRRPVGVWSRQRAGE